MKLLPVNERFHTWQGEGAHAGRSAFFIRLQGCPVKCPWCDSAGTWHPEWTPASVDKLTPEQLAEEAKVSGSVIVVITGGEPAIHDLSDLVDCLHSHGLAVHIETCGGFELKGDFDWVTLSPKWWKVPLDENLNKANEFKLIVEEPDTIAKWSQEIQFEGRKQPVWLHPEWSQAKNLEVLESISNWVKEYGDPYRAGYQLHKLYDVDRMDPGSRPLVPLGGNPNLGL